MAKFEPEQVTAIVDSREKLPWDLTPLQTRIATLSTGDYAISGLEHPSSGGICVERKSLADLLTVVGRGRERFEREVKRMLAFRASFLVIEASWGQIDMEAFEEHWRLYVKDHL